eukprot:TRINITY_DN47_c0_g3_i4.p1 TRINITY_DN47_c0_g3~~TRINITY_DN47_c0_g3_i4.p1  ORF type:complete len:2286 (+),score=558.41 TRINITY_DN47_c0_g3_i4:509-6859(+)
MPGQPPPASPSPEPPSSTGASEKRKKGKSFFQSLFSRGKDKAGSATPPPSPPSAVSPPPQVPGMSPPPQGQAVGSTGFTSAILGPAAPSETGSDAAGNGEAAFLPLSPAELGRLRALRARGLEKGGAPLTAQEAAELAGLEERRSGAALDEAVRLGLLGSPEAGQGGPRARHVTIAKDHRGMLGIGFDPRTMEVSSVGDAGPAQRAGLKPGMRVLFVEGTPVRSARDYKEALAAAPPSLELTVLLPADDAGTAQEATAPLCLTPPPSLELHVVRARARDRLGLRFRPGGGLCVESVVEDHPCARCGGQWAVGMRITHVDGVETRDLSEFCKAVEGKVDFVLLFDRVAAGADEVAVRREGDEPLGMELDPATGLLQSVTRGSPGALGGAGAMLRRRLTHVDGRQWKPGSDLDAEVRPGTVCVLRFETRASPDGSPVPPGPALGGGAAGPARRPSLSPLPVIGARPAAARPGSPSASSPPPPPRPEDTAARREEMKTAWARLVQQRLADGGAPPSAQLQQQLRELSDQADRSTPAEYLRVWARLVRAPPPTPDRGPAAISRRHSTVSVSCAMPYAPWAEKRDSVGAGLPRVGTRVSFAPGPSAGAPAAGRACEGHEPEPAVPAAQGGSAQPPLASPGSESPPPHLLGSPPPASPPLSPHSVAPQTFELHLQRAPSERLGLQFRPGGGVVVLRVAPGYAADRCGGRWAEGRRVTHVDGAAVRDAVQFAEAARGKESLTLRFDPVAAGPEEVLIRRSAAEPLGIDFDGLKVAAVRAGGAGALAGAVLMVGAELSHVDAAPVKPSDDLAKLTAGKTVLLLRFRGCGAALRQALRAAAADLAAAEAEEVAAEDAEEADPAEALARMDDDMTALQETLLRQWRDLGGKGDPRRDSAECATEAPHGRGAAGGAAAGGDGHKSGFFGKFKQMGDVLKVGGSRYTGAKQQQLGPSHVRWQLRDSEAHLPPCPDPPELKVTRGTPSERLGIRFMPGAGVVVMEVLAGELAAEHGGHWTVGRRVTHVDGAPVRDLRELCAAVQGRTEFTLRFDSVAASPDEVVLRREAGEPLGMVFGGDGGVRLLDAPPGGAGALGGARTMLRRRVTHVGGSAVASNEELMRALDAAAGGAAVLRFCDQLPTASPAHSDTEAAAHEEDRLAELRQRREQGAALCAEEQELLHQEEMRKALTEDLVRAGLEPDSEHHPTAKKRGILSRLVTGGASVFAKRRGSSSSPRQPGATFDGKGSIASLLPFHWHASGAEHASPLPSPGRDDHKARAAHPQGADGASRQGSGDSQPGQEHSPPHSDTPHHDRLSAARGWIGRIAGGLRGPGSPSASASGPGSPQPAPPRELAVSRGDPEERMGLRFRRGGCVVVLEVLEGEVAARCGGHWTVGRRVTHVDGAPVRDLRELCAAVQGRTEFTLRLEGNAAGPDEVLLCGRGGAEGMSFDAGMVLRAVADGSPAALSGAAQMLGRRLMHAAGAPVACPDELAHRVQACGEFALLHFAPPPLDSAEHAERTARLTIELEELATRGGADRELLAAERRAATERARLAELSEALRRRRLASLERERESSAERRREAAEREAGSSPRALPAAPPASPRGAAERQRAAARSVASRVPPRPPQAHQRQRTLSGVCSAPFAAPPPAPPRCGDALALAAARVPLPPTPQERQLPPPQAPPLRLPEREPPEAVAPAVPSPPPSSSSSSSSSDRVAGSSSCRPCPACPPAAPGSSPRRFLAPTQREGGSRGGAGSETASGDAPQRSPAGGDGGDGAAARRCPSSESAPAPPSPVPASPRSPFALSALARLQAAAADPAADVEQQPAQAAPLLQELGPLRRRGEGAASERSLSPAAPAAACPSEPPAGGDVAAQPAWALELSADAPSADAAPVAAEPLGWPALTRRGAASAAAIAAAAAALAEACAAPRQRRLPLWLRPPGAAVRRPPPPRPCTLPQRPPDNPSVSPRRAPPRLSPPPRPPPWEHLSPLPPLPASPPREPPPGEGALRDLCRELDSRLARGPRRRSNPEGGSAGEDAGTASPPPSPPGALWPGAPVEHPSRGRGRAVGPFCSAAGSDACLRGWWWVDFDEGGRRGLVDPSELCGAAADATEAAAAPCAVGSPGQSRRQ